MIRSINIIIFSALFLFCTILEAQACSTETTTTLTTTTIFKTTTCPYGAYVDRFGTCYLIRFYDHCEMLYGSERGG
jgi:hypothetical protein